MTFIDRIKKAAEYPSPDGTVVLHVNDVRLALLDRETWREKAITESLNNTLRRNS